MFDSKNTAVTMVSTSRVLWEKCFGEEICVNIPFDGRQCVSAKGCIRIIQDGTDFFIEIQLFGNTIRYKLANTCFPVYTIGVASIELCASIKGSQICISAKLCVGRKIGPINLGKCWKVVEECISFVAVSDLKKGLSSDPNFEYEELICDAMNADADYVYIQHLETASVEVPNSYDPKFALANLTK